VQFLEQSQSRQVCWAEICNWGGRYYTIRNYTHGNDHAFRTETGGVVIISSFVLGSSAFAPVLSDRLYCGSLVLVSVLSPKHWVRILPQVNNDHSLARSRTWPNISIHSFHTGDLKKNYFKSTYVQNLIFKCTTLALHDYSKARIYFGDGK
jgi:hypothetical protein